MFRSIVCILLLHSLLCLSDMAIAETRIVIHRPQPESYVVNGGSYVVDGKVTYGLLGRWPNKVSVDVTLSDGTIVNQDYANWDGWSGSHFDVNFTAPSFDQPTWCRVRASAIDDDILETVLWHYDSYIYIGP